ncbi:ABC transporter ATP-binding protein [Ferrovibrio sp.]|uniref:ABC transporter ATP-binding protein n=1 Tax=Ferrovibrio sp. TaxID=1917215 RepID=UPI00262C9191|nr:dipeptide ABC transporter ATP-binding protein [Ferrovibrio sp.]
MTGNLLEVVDLKKHYPLTGGLLGKSEGVVQAVNGVSFSIGRGETLAIVGESGCGKSTVARSVLGLIEPTGGEVFLEGTKISGLSVRQMRAYRRHLQVVFQDPYSSLNPRMTAAEIVAEPMRNYRMGSAAKRRELVAGLFAKVGLRPDQMDRFPHEFSGGQRQRLGIARALSLSPKIIVLDEPVSALDVSVQAQIVNLLIDLRNEIGLSYLFIAHDLAVVEHISDRVAVMYLGRMVELADKRSLFARPLHPYTKALLSAVPIPEPGAHRERIKMTGDIPSPIRPPSGCRFHPRCPLAQDRCKAEQPELRTLATGHQVACHFAETALGAV